MNKGVRNFLSELTSNADKNMCIVSTYEDLLLVNTSYIWFFRLKISQTRRVEYDIIIIRFLFNYVELLKGKISCRPYITDWNRLFFFFNNNQIMARSWKVQFIYKPLASVVTTVVWLLSQDSSNIQCNETYLPGKW